MLRISLVERPHQCRMIVEGTLVQPWADEFTTACERARLALEGRELIIDLKGITAFSSEGETALLQLIQDNIKFECGLFMREVLRQLARRSHLNDKR